MNKMQEVGSRCDRELQSEDTCTSPNQAVRGVHAVVESSPPSDLDDVADRFRWMLIASVRWIQSAEDFLRGQIWFPRLGGNCVAKCGEANLGGALNRAFSG